MGGFVSIVGAGPWDPELLTLAGQQRLARADFVVADYLVNPALLMHCRQDAVIIQRERGPRAPGPGALIDQRQINDLLVEHARAGEHVVRLKGGDPCVFGRGGEEAQHLARNGIAFELIPGVTSAVAAPEAAGIPVTHRDFTPAVSFVSGYEAYEKAGLQVEWEHLARSAGTIVLMMGVRNARQNADKLIEAGRDPATPAAIVRWGTRGIQRTIVSELGTLADQIEAENVRSPSIMIVGEVVRLREDIQFFEHRPLFGRRVLVTRATQQSGALIHMLAARGADAVAFPCLEVAPPADQEALDRAVASVPDAFDGVIVSSPNGVTALLHALRRGGLDVRALAGKQLAVIGTGTAARCRERTLEPDLIPKQARAEGLVELLSNRGLLGARWLHVRADEGRELIGSAVREAGGSYELAIGYRTIRPTVPTLLLRSLAPEASGGEGLDAVCFASGKAARHFIQTLTEGLGADATRDALAAAKVIAIGPVTTSALEALGIRVDQTATEASDDGLVAAVVTALTD